MTLYLDFKAGVFCVHLWCYTCFNIAVFVVQIIETENLMEHIVNGLSDPVTKVQLAAVRCMHSLSRSVQQLRTSFQDHCVWKPLMKVRTCLSVYLSVCLSMRTTVCLLVSASRITIWKPFMKVRTSLSVCCPSVCEDHCVSVSTSFQDHCVWKPLMKVRTCLSVCLYQILGPLCMETSHDGENLSVHING